MKTRVSSYSQSMYCSSVSRSTRVDLISAAAQFIGDVVEGQEPGPGGFGHTEHPNAMSAALLKLTDQPGEIGERADGRAGPGRVAVGVLGRPDREQAGVNRWQDVSSPSTE